MKIPTQLLKPIVSIIILDGDGSENDNGDDDGSFCGKSVGGNVRNEAAKLDSATREDETDIIMMMTMMKKMLMMMMLI